MTDRPIGLVLAGGRSRRMGRDKGTLIYAGEPQLRRAVRLLEPLSAQVLVSVRRDQAAHEGYRGLTLVEDAGDVAGPAAGLLAAWRREPAAALLVLAVDLPLVDTALLAELIAGRNPARLATTFVHADGTLEPLCTIWEPAAAAALAGRSESGSPSLRRLLETADVERLKPAEPDRLRSVNSPEDYREVAARLG